MKRFIRASYHGTVPREERVPGSARPMLISTEPKIAGERRNLIVIAMRGPEAKSEVVFGPLIHWEFLPAVEPEESRFE